VGYAVHMSDHPAIRPERIIERLKAVGLTERKASLLATGQPDSIRFMRTRGSMPSAQRLFQISKVLETTPEYLLGAVDVNLWNENKLSIEAAAKFDAEAFSDITKANRTIPISGARSFSDKIDDLGVEDLTLVISGFNRQVVGFAAAPSGLPPGLFGAVYINDPAMAPAFDASVPVVFQFDGVPKSGDYALIFIGGKIEGRELHGTSFLFRRLVDQAKEWLTLEQFSPPLKFNVPTANVVRLVRVLSYRDYVVPDGSGINTA
jgi:hypothetical protein